MDQWITTRLFRNLLQSRQSCIIWSDTAWAMNSTTPTSERARSYFLIPLLLKDFQITFSRWIQANVSSYQTKPLLLSCDSDTWPGTSRLLLGHKNLARYLECTTHQRQCCITIFLITAYSFHHITILLQMTHKKMYLTCKIHQKQCSLVLPSVVSRECSTHMLWIYSGHTVQSPLLGNKNHGYLFIKSLWSPLLYIRSIQVHTLGRGYI